MDRLCLNKPLVLFHPVSVFIGVSTNSCFDCDHVLSLTGEEVLLIQEKLDGIKSRYAEMTAGSSKALRTLEQALQLATRFASSHDDISQWLDSVEAELNNIETDTTPAYQDRQRVRMSTVLSLLSTDESLFTFCFC